MLSQQECMDLSKEARKAQDAMSLAGTDVASSNNSGPDYQTVGKSGKLLKLKSSKYNIQAAAMSNHRGTLDSWTSSIL